MKSEESTFTHFNFSFITFPRQVFVNIIDDKREGKPVGEMFRIITDAMILFCLKGVAC